MMYLQEPELFGCGNYVPVLYHKEKRWSPIRTNFGKMLVDKISPKGWEALIWSSDTTGQNIKGPVVVTWIFVRGRGQFFFGSSIATFLVFHFQATDVSMPPKFFVRTDLAYLGCGSDIGCLFRIWPLPR